MGHNWKKGHTWKKEPHLEERVALVKMGTQLQQDSHTSRGRCTLGKMGHTWNKMGHTQKMGTYLDKRVKLAKAHTFTNGSDLRKICNPWKDRLDLEKWIAHGSHGKIVTNCATHFSKCVLFLQM